MIYTMNIARDPLGAWTADLPQVPGAHTCAESREELDACVREVIALGEDLPAGAEAALRLTYVNAEN